VYIFSENVGNATLFLVFDKPLRKNIRVKFDYDPTVSSESKLTNYKNNTLLSIHNVYYVCVLTILLIVIQ